MVISSRTSAGKGSDAEYNGFPSQSGCKALKHPLAVVWQVLKCPQGVDDWEDVTLPVNCTHKRITYADPLQRLLRTWTPYVLFRISIRTRTPSHVKHTQGSSQTRFSQRDSLFHTLGRNPFFSLGKTAVKIRWPLNKWDNFFSSSSPKWQLWEIYRGKVVAGYFTRNFLNSGLNCFQTRY